MLRTSRGTLLSSVVSVNSSIDQYYTTYTFSNVDAIADEVIHFENDGRSLALHILNAQHLDSGYVYTCVDEHTFKFLQSTYPAVTGYYTFKELCHKLGIPATSTFNTPTQYWSFQSCNLLNFIDLLNEQLAFNLSAPRAYLGTSGKLEVINFAQAMKAHPVHIPLHINEFHTTKDWQLESPASINIVRYKLLDIETYTLNLHEGYSSARMYVNDTTGEAFQQYINQATNEFMLSWYTASKYQATVANQFPYISLGTHIKSLSGFSEGVVTSVSYAHDDTKYSQTLTYVCPPNGEIPNPKLTRTS